MLKKANFSKITQKKLVSLYHYLRCCKVWELVERIFGKPVFFVKKIN